VYLEGCALYLVQEDAQGSSSSTLPELTGQGGIYFWDTLLEGKLELKAGFRGRYVSRATEPRFNPEALAYVDLFSSTGAWSRLDFMAQAQIGAAQVHFIWENLTNVNYYGTPYYPGLDRSIRFGISWEFLN
jgi:hypothetical protein